MLSHLLSRHRLLVIGVGLYIVIFLLGFFFRNLAVQFFGSDIWPNLEATAISFPLETAFVYFVIDSIVATREEERAIPARRIVAAKLALAHRLILSGAFVALRPPSELDLGTHYKGPKNEESTAAFNLRLSGLAPCQYHLNELKELIDLSSVSLGAEWLPIVVSHYTSARRVLASFMFFVDSWNPRHSGKVDFIGIFPEKSLQNMETSYQWLLKRFPELERDKQGLRCPAVISIKMIIERTISECPNISISPKTYIPSSPDAIICAEDMDVMMNINTLHLSDGQHIHVARQASE